MEVVRAALTALTAFAVAALSLVVVLASSFDGRDGRSRGAGLRPADVERGTPVAQAAPVPAGVDLAVWAAETASTTRVPADALRAYGAAEQAMQERNADCRLSWSTLAGIGRVESDHGRIGRSELDADGLARPPIVGVPLDGSRGVREIRDTDGGRLDDDRVYDRAVGPMQFLPATWVRYGADGDGDGVADPQDVDDAALAAARYLCAEGRDTASGEGWWDGVLEYNRSVEYARTVWAVADRYATATTAP